MSVKEVCDSNVGVGCAWFLAFSGMAILIAAAGLVVRPAE